MLTARGGDYKVPVYQASFLIEMHQEELRRKLMKDQGQVLAQDL